MARILVIDDSRLAATATRVILEHGGHEVVTTPRADLGLELLDEESFDCITVDVLMPGMSGIEFLHSLNERGCEVPVIVATADIQHTTRDTCLEAGARSVLPKPLDPDHLVALIAEVTGEEDKDDWITADQRDALTELVNMGVGRAASALNDLVQGHIELQVPYLELTDLRRLGEVLTGLGTHPVSSVQMGFHGGMDGSAFLVFPPSSALELVQIVLGEDSEPIDLDTMHAATLTEVGNIVISAVMGTLGNALRRPLDYSLPVYEQEPVVDLIAMRKEGEPLILIAKTRFTIRRARTIEGHLLLLFELDSIESLIAPLLAQDS